MTSLKRTLDTDMTAKVTKAAKVAKVASVINPKTTSPVDSIVFAQPEGGGMLGMAYATAKNGREPAMLRLSGGGRIPPVDWAIKVRGTKTTLALTVDDPREDEWLRQLSQLCEDLVYKQWSTSADYKPYALLSVPPPPTAGKRPLSGRIAVSIEGTGRVQLASDKTRITDMESLRGMKWTSAIVEVRSIYIQHKEQRFGVSVRLHRLNVAPGDTVKVVTVEESQANPSPGVSRTQLAKDIQINEACLGTIVTDKVKLVKLRHPESGPLCVQLSGGGYIPQTFGIDDTVPDKVYMSLSIGDPAEDAQLRAINDQVVALATRQGHEWSTVVPADKWAEINHSLISDKKLKPDSTESYDALVKGLVTPELLMVNGSTGVDLAGLRGVRWTKVVIEFRFVYIQGKKAFGLAKRIRVLETAPMDGEYVLPDSDDDEQ